jgi:hypothetical protein
MSRLFSFLIFSILFILVGNRNFAQNWIQEGQTLLGSNNNDSFGTSLEMSSDGLTMIVGNPLYEGQFGSMGAVSVYSLIDGEWVQKGTTIIGDIANGEFGAEVHISNDGNVIAVYARSFGDFFELNGVVLTYFWNGTDWEQLGDIISGPSYSYHAESFDLNGPGNRLAILNYANEPFVKVYEFQKDVWVQILGLPNNPDGYVFANYITFNESGDVFALGDEVYVGDGDIYYAGRVRTFEETPEGWVERDELQGALLNGYFGHNLSLSSSGDDLAVSAFGSDLFSSSGGAVYVYHWNGLSWEQRGSTLGVESGDNFGRTVKISGDGDHLIVYQLYADLASSTGEVFTYSWINNNWSNTSIDFTIVGSDLSDYYYPKGTAISNNGEKIAISSLDSRDIRGRVRTYKRNTISSVDESSASNESVKVYTTSEQTIQVESTSTIQHVEVLSYDGKSVFEWSGNGDKKYQINLAVSDGIYLVKVTNVEGQSEIRKLFLK